MVTNTNRQETKMTRAEKRPLKPTAEKGTISLALSDLSRPAGQRLRRSAWRAGLRKEGLRSPARTEAAGEPRRRQPASTRLAHAPVGAAGAQGRALRAAAQRAQAMAAEETSCGDEGTKKRTGRHTPRRKQFCLL